MPKSSLIGKNKKVNPWWDDDGDGIGYEEGEVSGKFTKKKKSKLKVAKESFCNWRQDLFEIIDEIDSQKKNQIKENPKIKNTIKINPQLEEKYITEDGIIFYDMKEVCDIFSDLNEHEISYLNSYFIEKVVEEAFYELLDEGYELFDIEDTILESIDSYESILTEAKVTLGHDTEIKSDRLGKVKSAVKTVGKAIARGAGYAAGAAVRGAKALGREVGSGYQRGSQGSSESSTSTKSKTYSDSDDSDSESTTQRKPGILSRIGSSLKSGLKRAVRGTGRAVGTAVRGAKAAKREFGAGYQRGSQGSSDKGRVVTPDTQAHPKSPGSRSIREPKEPPKVGSERRVEVAGRGSASSKPTNREQESSASSDKPKPQASVKTTKVDSDLKKRQTNAAMRALRKNPNLSTQSLERIAQSVESFNMIEEDDVSMSNNPQVSALTTQIERLQSKRAQMVQQLSRKKKIKINRTKNMNY